MGLIRCISTQPATSYTTDNLPVPLQDTNTLILIYHYLHVVDIVRCRLTCRYFNQVTYHPLIRINHINLLHGYQYTSAATRHYYYHIQSYVYAMKLVKCLQLNSKVFNLVDCISIHTDQHKSIPIELFKLLSQRPRDQPVREFQWTLSSITNIVFYQHSNMVHSLNTICQFNQLHTLRLQVTFETKPTYVTSTMLSLVQIRTLHTHSPQLRILSARVHDTDINTLLELFTGLEQLSIFVEPREHTQPIEAAQEVSRYYHGSKLQTMIKHIYIMNGVCAWLLQLEPWRSLQIRYGSERNFKVLRLLRISVLVIQYTTAIKSTTLEPENDVFDLLLGNGCMLSTTITHLQIISPDADIPFNPLFQVIDEMNQLRSLQICSSQWNLSQLIELKRQQPNYVHPHNHTHPKYLQ